MNKDDKALLQGHARLISQGRFLTEQYIHTLLEDAYNKGSIAEADKNRKVK